MSGVGGGGAGGLWIPLALPDATDRMQGVLADSWRAAVASLPVTTASPMAPPAPPAAPAATPPIAPLAGQSLVPPSLSPPSLSPPSLSPPGLVPPSLSPPGLSPPQSPAPVALPPAGALPPPKIAVAQPAPPTSRAPASATLGASAPGAPVTAGQGSPLPAATPLPPAAPVLAASAPDLPRLSTATARLASGAASLPSTLQAVLSQAGYTRAAPAAPPASGPPAGATPASAPSASAPPAGASPASASLASAPAPALGPLSTPALTAAGKSVPAAPSAPSSPSPPSATPSSTPAAAAPGASPSPLPAPQAALQAAAPALPPAPGAQPHGPARPGHDVLPTAIAALQGTAQATPPPTAQPAPPLAPPTAWPTELPQPRQAAGAHTEPQWRRKRPQPHPEAFLVSFDLATAHVELIAYTDNRPVPLDLYPASQATPCWRLDDTQALVVAGSSPAQAAGRAASLHASLMDGGLTLPSLAEGEGFATWQGSPLWLRLAGIDKPASLGILPADANPQRVEVLRTGPVAWSVRHLPAKAPGGSAPGPGVTQHLTQPPAAILLARILFGQAAAPMPLHAGLAIARAALLPTPAGWRVREAWAAVQTILARTGGACPAAGACATLIAHGLPQVSGVPSHADRAAMLDAAGQGGATAAAHLLVYGRTVLERLRNAELDGLGPLEGLALAVALGRLTTLQGSIGGPG